MTQPEPGDKSGIVPVDEDTFTTCMEQLQEGYVQGVAATAGCTLEFIRRDIHGFDVLITRRSDPGVQEVSIYAQLKNTTTVRPDTAKPTFSYQFKRRDNLLRLTEPRRDPKAILLVMVTSKEQAAWTACDHDSLTMQYCCYWANLEGQTPEPGVAHPTVHVPTGNVFDAAALRHILDRADRGEEFR